MVVVLGWLYTLYGGLSWMQAVFYGVGASVIGIIAHSAYKLTTKTIGRDPLLWAIFLVTAIVTILTQSEQVLLFLAVAVEEDPGTVHRLGSRCHRPGRVLSAPSLGAIPRGTAAGNIVGVARLQNPARAYSQPRYGLAQTQTAGGAALA